MRLSILSMDIKTKSVVSNLVLILMACLLLALVIEESLFGTCKELEILKLKKRRKMDLLSSYSYMVVTPVKFLILTGTKMKS